MTDRTNPLRVLGVLAGADMRSDLLRAWAESAEVVLAADGGADRLHEAGFVPEATIGDLDSISAQTASEQRELIHDRDQNTTDCDKLLSLATSRGFTSITLAGVEGDLIDHVVGTLFSAAQSTLEVRIALRRGLGYIVKGPAVREWATVAGSRFSVLPVTHCEEVRLTGTRWELDRSALDAMGLTSLSNIAESELVRLSLGSGCAFVFRETDSSPYWGD